MERVTSLRVLSTVCCLLLAFHASDSAIQRPPENHADMMGGTVVLICEVHAAPPLTRVMWGEYVTSSIVSPISDNEFILAHPNSNRYRIIHNTTTAFYLEIRDLRLEDGGRYVCQDTLSGPPQLYRGEMELIVLETNPVCNSTAPPDNQVLEGQMYTIECRVNYQGQHPPKMTWTGPPPFDVATPPPTPTTVWSGIQYVVDRSMDLRSYECNTSITDVPNQPEGVAGNTPTWSYLHRGPQIFVYWGPKNLFATPVQAEYEVGDTITCTADSRPEATYFWQNMRTLEQIYSRYYTVGNDMIGFNTSMRCMAQNIIGGFVYSENLFHPVLVRAPTTPTTTTPPPPTTTFPPQADCTDLSGHWIANNPRAEFVIRVIPGSQTGEVEGVMKNNTETIWVEVVGTTRFPDFGYLGLASIWPFNDGVTGFSGECHRCHGLEMIIGSGMWRSRLDSVLCGHGGNPYVYEEFYFYRAGTVRSALDGRELDVHNPTAISSRLGVTLKKKK